MKKLGDLLTRHRNLFLLLLLLSTLAVSSVANRERLEEASATVHIPVTSAVPGTVSRLESYRQARDETYQSDLTALEALCAQSDLDERTREDAAARMQVLIDCRQGQNALEGALLNSSLSPCVAVVAGGSVTIVTEKSAITQADSALVMTLAKAHVDVAPECVRIITAE